MSDCCGDSGLSAVRIPSSTPSGGEGFVRSIRWVDLRIGPGGDGTEQEPYDTVTVGFTAIPNGGTLMVVGGDASGESPIALDSKSATVVGLSGQDDDGGRKVVLPLLEYAISTGTQELAFRNVSVVLTHTGADNSLTELWFDHCPSVSLLADGDAPTVHWVGDDACSFSGSGGAAALEGGTIAGYVANSGAVTIRAARVTGNVTSPSAVTLLGGCTFGAGVTITAPSITLDIASHRAAVVAGVSFSSTPVLQANFAAAVDIGTANAAGSANSLARSDHVHDLPFTPVQEALAAATASVSFNSQKITNLATPTSSLDAVNKAYADAIAVGLRLKDPAVAVAVANQATMSGTAQTVDGVALNTIGQRVLLTAQTTATQNGLWVVASGAWTRPADFDTGDGAALSYVPVTGGTVYAGSGWLDTNTAGTDVIDTDDLTWGLFTQPATIVAGAGLTNTGNTYNVIANADGSIVANSDDIQVGVLATDAQHGARGGGTQHAVATTSVAGFLSAADKTKLDGVVFGSPTDVGTANADGVATTYPRSDHVHRLTFATVAAVLAVASSAISVNGQKITNLDTPTDSGDAANKAYVDAIGFITAGAGLTKTGGTIDVVTADATIVVTANDIKVGVIQTANMAANSATDTIIRDSAGFSVIGKATTGSGDPADIVAGTDTVLGRNGSGNLTFQQVQTGMIAGDAVTYAKMQNVTATARLMGRITAGAGDMEELTGAQALSLLPAPGSTTQVIYNNAGAFDAASGITIVGSETALAFGAAPSATGAIRLSNATDIKARNAAASGDLSLIRSDSSDNTLVGTTNAGGDVYLDVASGKTIWLRFAGATQDFRFTSTFADFTDNWLQFGTAPAASGIIRLSSNTGISARNAANSADASVIRTDNANNVVIGDQSVTVGTYLDHNLGAAGAFHLRWNGIDDYVATADYFDFKDNNARFGAAPAASGTIRLSNNTHIAARNAAGSADILLARTDSSNNIVYGDTTNGNDLYLDAPSGKVHHLRVAGGDEYTFSDTLADFKTNAIQWGTNPASAGAGLRIPHNFTLLTGRNSANSANGTLIGWGLATNALQIGGGGGGASIVDGLYLDVNTSGTVYFRENGTIQYTFASTTADFSDSALRFGSTPAASGTIRFTFSASAVTHASFRNGANSGDVKIFGMGSTGTNHVDLGDASGTHGSHLNLYGTAVNIKPDDATTYTFDNGGADFGTNELDFQYGGKVAFYLSGNTTLGAWMESNTSHAGLRFDTDSTSESVTFYINGAQRIRISDTLTTISNTVLNLNGTTSIDDAVHVGFEAVSAPSNPASAGEWRIYADAGTGRLRAKNNSGTIRDLALP